VTTEATDWRPGASLDVLQLRAGMLSDIRDFFRRRRVMEVTTPLMSAAGATEPNLESYRVLPPHASGPHSYLQTSPEFPMKRLLAAGAGSIYQICPVFRCGESGSRHNPEFTMIEWYRPGLDLDQLMIELIDLLAALLPKHRMRGPAVRIPYQDLFKTHFGLDPLSASGAELQACARERGLGTVAGLDATDRDAWLDLLISHCIEPHLDSSIPTFVHGYPASQAALACLDPDDPRLARRFELYLGGMELANGYHELADANELAARFARDNGTRRKRGLSPVPVDLRLLAAVSDGLPDCVGVALGFDRLVMLAADLETVDQAMAFSMPRA